MLIQILDSGPIFIYGGHMKTMNWCKQLEASCRQEMLWGVSISFSNFELEIQWPRFIEKVESLGFSETETRDCLFGIINDELILCNKTQAEWLYSIMEEKEFSDKVYACLISPVEGIITENS